MRSKRILAGLLLATTATAPALAQDGEVTIVLCEGRSDGALHGDRSNIGRIVLRNISETVTELDVQGDEGVKPRLAESWEEVDEDTWRFNLRQGVTFSDGSAFDAT